MGAAWIPSIIERRAAQSLAHLHQILHEQKIKVFSIKPLRFEGVLLMKFNLDLLDHHTDESESNIGCTDILYST